MATNQPFSTAARLSQIAMAVKPVGMIADQAAPRIAVPSEEFIYTKYTVEDRFTITDTRIGRKSEPNQVEFGGADITDKTEDRGLDDFVPKKDLDKARDGNTNFDPEASAVEGLATLVDLDRESKVATLYNTLTTFSASLRATLSGTSQWSHASSNPVTAIMQAMDMMLVRPNVLILGREVWTALRTHAAVVAAVLGAQGVGAASGASGVVSLQAAADLFGLERILIGETFYNSAKPGQTASMARLWGKHATLARIDPGVRNVRGGAMPSFMATAEWQGRRTRVIPDPKRGIDGGNTYRVAEQIKEIVLWQEAAYHFHDAVA